MISTGVYVHIFERYTCNAEISMRVSKTRTFCGNDKWITYKW